MKNSSNKSVVVVAFALAALLFSTWIAAGGSKYERIEAVAQGQGTQLSQRYSITIIIYEISPTEDHKILTDAFNAGGQEGLYNALSKMKAKGHIAITGTLGYDINFIREFQTPEGRKLRVVTNRPIRFGEAWADTRSKDYSLSAFELLISPEKNKSEGVLFPRMELKVNPEKKEVQIEAFQNPWKLQNILYYPAK